MDHPAQVSFMLGAGFSIPAGYPSARGLNDMFGDLRESQFAIHSDWSAWMCDSEETANAWTSYPSARKFACQLVAYYRSGPGKCCPFHYEDFVDWYKHIRTGKISDPNIAEIARQSYEDPVQALFRFDLVFHQLVASVLLRHHPEHFADLAVNPYRRFLDLVGFLAARNTTVHFHTLNHDLFLETLARSPHFPGNLDDGFRESGSPFRGDRKDSSMASVVLPRFVDKFDSSMRLYKLHGSIDQYVDQGETFKTRLGIGPTDFLRLVVRGSHEISEEVPGQYDPDYLTGTEFKITRYKATSYYTHVFAHFTENLRSSSCLVVIGYGWHDTKINEIIRDNYCPSELRRILDINITANTLDAEWRRFVDYFSGGVVGFDLSKVSAALVSAMPAT